jgi:two-component system chemotaxis response regulator CheB
VLPAARIAESIERLAGSVDGREGGPGMPRAKDVEPQLLSETTEVADMTSLFGPPSGLTCPDCGGALWEIEEDRVRRYQCHVGHQYAPENLEAGQRDAIDSALWSAVRVLEEHAELKLRMAHRAAAGGLSMVSEGFAEGARDAREQADRIRSVLLREPNASKPGGLSAVQERDEPTKKSVAGLKGNLPSRRRRTGKA